MGHTLQRLNLDRQTVWQYRPSWWGVRVDFYMAASGVIIQVDGSAHFVGTYRKLQLPELARKDLEFNQAAWSAGAKVFRVHHKDLDHMVVWQLLQQLAAIGNNKAGPLLLLSPSYWQVKWRWQPNQPAINYVECMAKQLVGCKVVVGAANTPYLQPLTM